jgi:biotin-dependent carboxylase-like uncharacterized protein
MITTKNSAMIRVKEAGFYTTVQDLGRFGFRHFGVPVSGVADAISALRVNAMLENSPEDAVLEMTMQGAVLEFTAPTSICLGGAPMEAFLDNEELENDKVYRVIPNQVLRCGRVLKGLRTYLAIKGGFKQPVILGSRSYFKSITSKQSIEIGETLEYIPDIDFEPKILKWNHPEHIGQTTLKCSVGPEFERLDKSSKDRLLGGSFSVGKEFNRMGCQLEERINEHAISIITSATLPGTVQLTPSGKIIILLCDGQTTGGYPRILQLHSEALSIMAQKRTGDTISFALSECD